MATFTLETDSSARWEQAWAATGREPFAHPAYVELQCGTGEEARAVCWADDGGEILLPLVTRPLPDSLEVREVSDQGWVDAVSPYGYGGPFTSGAPDVAAFMSALLEWMREARVVTAFLRASLGVPMPASLDLDGYEAVHLADNVVVDLGRSPEEQWSTYEHKVRKNVNKARRAGLQVTVRDDFDGLEAFLGIYHDTMRRRSASDHYYFGADYFATIRDRMAGSYWVADVLDGDGRTVSTELVLTSDRRCYSFLGGTLEDAFPMAPNDLLKHEVISHAAGLGMDGYVLGGGYQPGDGIFRYKRAFDPEGVQPFQGVRLTADSSTYDALCAARRGGDPGSFFPAYRAP
ncbi:GNAT family N-acetyltransferase [Nocardioides sp. LHG3406-4]|uniref:GNAT family N-acetyltransferase n=1 Tax=Nocardioides sp. LHG3406-4 TaxID=2804575 RepID=UPI003CF9BB7B